MANRAYDDVEISGSELTFTRGNGGYTKVEIPNGGDEWVSITSFANIDTSKLKIGSQIMFNLIQYSSDDIRCGFLTCMQIGGTYLFTGSFYAKHGSGTYMSLNSINYNPNGGSSAINYQYADFQSYNNTVQVYMPNTSSIQYGYVKY